MKLSLVPLPLAEANAFVEQHHRHHGPVVGARFSIGAAVDEPDRRCRDRRAPHAGVGPGVITCPVCGREVALRRGSRMRVHRPFNVERDSGSEVGIGGVSRPSGVCLGSGLTSQCGTCDGDGYTETWNDDQSDVVITLCADCEGTGCAHPQKDPK